MAKIRVRALERFCFHLLNVIISDAVLKDLILYQFECPELSYIPDLGYVTTNTSSGLV